MASPNLSELVATTLDNYSGMLADNVKANCPLLLRLESRDNIDTFDGGRRILQELSYQENETGMWYSGGQVLDTRQTDVISAAEYEIKQYAVAVIMTGLDDLQNASKEQVLPLLKSRIKVARATMENAINAGLLSDGTGFGGKQIGGIQQLIATAPTSGTVGGINRASNEFWRNQTETGTTLTEDNIEKEMRDLYLKVQRNMDEPDLIAATADTYALFWANLTSRQRYTGDVARKAKEGFSSLAFLKADVLNIGGVDGSSLANRMFFLNTKYLHYRPHSRRNMVNIVRGGIQSQSQDARINRLGWAGNLTMSNAKVQGVILGS